MAPKRSKNQLRREKAKLRKLENSEVKKDLKETATQEQPEDEKEPVKDDTSTSKPETSTDVNKKEVPDLSSQKENSEAKDQNGTKKAAANSTQAPTTTGPIKLSEDDFKHVFAKFNASAPVEQTSIIKHTDDTYSSDSSSEDDDLDIEYEKPLSKRQQRLRNKVTIAELKASTEKPGIIAWYDANAPDPYLNVAFKTTFNAIGVPSHWLQKRDYLSGKRGFELPPFKLPKFIQDTGIAEMRNYDPESLKKLQRERVQPKMGKLDIDYQRLHDAFFKFQTKPRHYQFGELYWEGREKADQHLESVIHMRPGVVSKRLKEAVGLSPSDPNIVPPWVTLMNLIGKPPSFYDSIIPGVDVTYENTGYKSSSGGDLNLQKEGRWGAFDKDVESDYDDEDEDEEDEEEVEDSEGEQAADSSNETSIHEEDEADAPEKIDITEYSKYKTDTKQAKTNGGLDQLYKVLKERQAAASDGSGDRKTVYDLADNVEENKEEAKNNAKDEQKEVENFEF